MKWLDVLRRTPTIRFKSVFGRADIAMPVQAAKAVRPHWLHEQFKEKRVKFARCPGMFDYLQAGYIVPAWCDIHIKANRQGVIVKLSHMHDPTMAAVEMDFSVIDGMAAIDASVAKRAIKVPVPWAVFTKPGYSAMVMPAPMHSPFLDRLFVYSGIVDYENFHTINFIFSPVKECEFVIPAGTPLLQVIPFRNEPMTAVVGDATENERGHFRFKFCSRLPGFYRRAFHKKKHFSLTVEDNK